MVGGTGLSNLNKWNEWHVRPGFAYSETITHRLAADFLADCSVVEDWGSGVGQFKKYRPDAICVDGSDHATVDRKADLVGYVSKCDGIYMRSVLEWNDDWRQILNNAIDSAKKRICIIVAVPMRFYSETLEGRSKDLDVPVYSLGKVKLHTILQAACFATFFEEKKTECSHGVETIFYATKRI
jgi:hypothetical protein